MANFPAKVKRFLVFGFDSYYPAGGWNDFKASFDSYEEAVAWINGDLRDPDEPSRGSNSDYYQVVALNTSEVTDF